MYEACSRDVTTCQHDQASPGKGGLACTCTLTAGAHGGLQAAKAMHCWSPQLHKPQHQVHHVWAYMFGACVFARNAPSRSLHSMSCCCRVLQCACRAWRSWASASCLTLRPYTGHQRQRSCAILMHLVCAWVVTQHAMTAARKTHDQGRLSVIRVQVPGPKPCQLHPSPLTCSLTGQGAQAPCRWTAMFACTKITAQGGRWQLAADQATTG